MKSLLPKEALPDWLKAAGEAGEQAAFDLGCVLRDSLYYPACGLNGTPIKHFSGFVHSFVYADYSINESDYLRDINLPGGMLGYSPVLQRRLSRQSVVPANWQPPMRPHRSRWGVLRRREFRAQPFGQWSIWKRDPQFDEAHGPDYFSLLFLCGEMSATYQGLYLRLGIAPKVIALIQPGSMGGEWEQPVRPDSFFKQVVDANPAGLPQYLLRGSYTHDRQTESEWPEFQHKFHHISERSATLWMRS